MRERRFHASNSRDCTSTAPMSKRQSLFHERSRIIFSRSQTGFGFRYTLQRLSHGFLLDPS